MSDIIKKKIEALRKALEKHNENYYILDAPTISDEEFDQKLKELETLEKAHPEHFDINSPTQRVGSRATENFKTITHQNRMYSLTNSYHPEDLYNWEKRIQKIIDQPITYSCELKYDGVSINISYQNGKLLQAVTRGDGLQGDEITDNIKTIPSLPLEIENFIKDFDIRGEVILPLKGFQKMNEKRLSQGKEAYANPRNTTSGSLKLLDSKEVAKRPLDCLLYQVIAKDNPYKTHTALLEKAREAGFKIPKTIKKAQNMEEVLDFINHWNQKRGELPYETDGVVIKINELDAQEELGYTAKAPRWAMAYKFKAEQAYTELKSVDYQVGRTGAITPVANLKPVALGGTLVKRASLHNAEQIEKLDLRLGDYVFIEKGGEIIPKIIKADVTQRKNTSPLHYITHCPECDTKLKKLEEDAKHYCPNEDHCPPQVIGRIEHYTSRNALNIDSLGGETIKLLYKEGLVKDYADLYELQKKHLLPLERMADKSAENILKGIEKSKKTPFEKILFGLGIRFVGATVAKNLAQHFKNIDALLKAGFEDLTAIDEIGDKIAKSVVAFSKDSSKITLIKRLKQHGVRMQIDDTNTTQSNKLNGKNFVVSGVFHQFSREDLKKAIESNGGKVTSTLSKKTHYIVAGDKMGPRKLEKAEKLQIPIISEKDFIKMVE